MAKIQYTPGSKSKSVNIKIQDSSSIVGAGLSGFATAGGSVLSGMTAYYSFAGANATSHVISLAPNALITTAWTSGSLTEIDATHMKGVARFDIPDACLAANVGEICTISFSGGANAAPTDLDIELVADVPGGRAGLVQAGATSTTVVLDSGASSLNDYYNGRGIEMTAGTSLGQFRTIVGYVGSTKVATVDRAWDTALTPVTGDGFQTYKTPGANVVMAAGVVTDPTASDNYTADIEFDRDSANSRDEYRVIWLKNGAPVTSSLSGATPTIRVVDDTGADLIASTAMTQVTGINGWLYYNATTTSGSGSTNERVTLGNTYLAIVTCSIDGVTQSSRSQIRRDG